jgi:hypothetical protein
MRSGAGHHLAAALGPVGVKKVVVAHDVRYTPQKKQSVPTIVGCLPNVTIQ